MLSTPNEIHFKYGNQLTFGFRITTNLPSKAHNNMTVLAAMGKQKSNYIKIQEIFQLSNAYNIKKVSNTHTITKSATESDMYN